MGATSQMLAILQADAELAAILPGGIWDRPLNPSDPEMRDVAWQPHPDTGVKRLVPCGVMLEPQEVDHPFALNPGRRLDVDQWPELYLYAGADVMAEVFDAADERAMELLHGQRIGFADITATGFRARPLEADELPGTVWQTFRRYRVQTVRHM